MTLKKELPIITIVLLPFIYLGYIWNQLPEKVPVHWNINGEIDRYGEKTELLLIPFLLPFLIYIIFLVIPKIDPKNKLNKMGNKYQTLKILMTTFMAVLALLILYSAKNQSFANSNYVVLLMGLLLIISGNFFKTIKANYFIGIRTPWTLENETVWKETHKMGGILWFIGGIIVVLASFILDTKPAFTVLFIITAIIVIIPVAYSYVRFKKEEKNGLEQGV